MKKCGALIEDSHFVYVSGYHGSGFIAPSLITLQPEQANRLSVMLAEAIVQSGVECDFVCHLPSPGGAVAAQYTALALDKPCIFTERSVDSDQALVLRHHFDELVRNKAVLIVDDVSNTGGSLKKAVDAIRRSAGRVVRFHSKSLKI